MNYIKYKAFTLVELIVVVTILAILATIGFVSYSSYLTGVRDTNRLAQLVSIHDGLELYRTRNDLPLPDDSVEVQASGITLAYQGYAGANTLETIDFTKGGQDPRDKQYFSYYITKDRKYFQLMAFLEEEASITSQGPSIESVLAVDYSDRFPTVYGRKMGILTDSNKTPIQEIGNIDLVTAMDSYIAHITDDETLSGTGSQLQVLEYALSVAKVSPSSCKELLSMKTFKKNGIYRITLNGSNREVYCDMITNGGGWTLVKRIGKLGRNGKISTDRIGVMVEDAQMGEMSDLRPDGEEFAKMSDTDINYMNFSEVMHTQDGSNDVVFVYTSVIDSDLAITPSSSFDYKNGINGQIESSSLTSTSNGCTKYGIYISEGNSFNGCNGLFLLSVGGYIHTTNINGFGINGTYTYTNQMGTQWVR